MAGPLGFFSCMLVFRSVRQRSPTSTNEFLQAAEQGLGPSTGPPPNSFPDPQLITCGLNSDGRSRGVDGIGRTQSRLSGLAGHQSRSRAVLS